MTEAEKAFLAFLAVGVFSIDQHGKIWKHRRLIGGSQTGTPPYWKDQRPEVAAKSKSAGYPTVMFSDGRTRHKVFVHRVVWMLTAQQDIPNGMQINHKNGIRGDTRPINLELMTPSQNVIHAIRVLGRKPKAQEGEMNAMVKLTESEVLKIRALAGKMPQSKIGAMFRVSQGTISGIVLGKTWTHLQSR